VLKEELWCSECREPATTVDHVVCVAEGGTDARENLRALCTKCQLSKAGREGARARERNRN
jgi:5-methylcytosine-specific restriction endonuclease McrA